VLTLCTYTITIIQVPRPVDSPFRCTSYKFFLKLNNTMMHQKSWSIHDNSCCDSKVGQVAKSHVRLLMFPGYFLRGVIPPPQHSSPTKKITLIIHSDDGELESNQSVQYQSKEHSTEAQTSRWLIHTMLTDKRNAPIIEILNISCSITERLVHPYQQFLSILTLS